MMTDEQLIELAGRAGLNIGYNKVGLVTTEWRGPPLEILRKLKEEFIAETWRQNTPRYNKD